MGEETFFSYKVASTCKSKPVILIDLVTGGYLAMFGDILGVTTEGTLLARSREARGAAKSLLC